MKIENTPKLIKTMTFLKSVITHSSFIFLCYEILWCTEKIPFTFFFSNRGYEIVKQFSYAQGKTCALVNSVQKFIEMQGWLLLFFICVHNQIKFF